MMSRQSAFGVLLVSGLLVSCGGDPAGPEETTNKGDIAEPSVIAIQLTDASPEYVLPCLTDADKESLEPLACPEGAYPLVSTYLLGKLEMEIDVKNIADFEEQLKNDPACQEEYDYCSIVVGEIVVYREYLTEPTSYPIEVNAERDKGTFAIWGTNYLLSKRVIEHQGLRWKVSKLAEGSNLELSVTTRWQRDYPW